MANLAYIFTMRTKLCSYAFVFGALLLASNCLAQKVPVVMGAPASVNERLQPRWVQQVTGSQY